MEWDVCRLYQLGPTRKGNWRPSVPGRAETFLWVKKVAKGS